MNLGWGYGWAYRIMSPERQPVCFFERGPRHPVLASIPQTGRLSEWFLKADEDTTHAMTLFL